MIRTVGYSKKIPHFLMEFETIHQRNLPKSRSTYLHVRHQDILSFAPSLPPAMISVHVFGLRSTDHNVLGTIVYLNLVDVMDNFSIE